MRRRTFGLLADVLQVYITKDNEIVLSLNPTVDGVVGVKCQGISCMEWRAQVTVYWCSVSVLNATKMNYPPVTDIVLNLTLNPTSDGVASCKWQGSSGVHKSRNIDWHDTICFYLILNLRLFTYLYTSVYIAVGRQSIHIVWSEVFWKWIFIHKFIPKYLFTLFQRSPASRFPIASGSLKAVLNAESKQTFRLAITGIFGLLLEGAQAQETSPPSLNQGSEVDKPSRPTQLPILLIFPV